MTYNGTWRIYLNGVLDMTPVAVNQPVRADSTQDAGLGTAMNSGGTPVGAFNGIMDEARIWNTIRSEAQIQAAMTGPLATSPGHGRPLEHGRGHRRDDRQLCGHHGQRHADTDRCS